MQEETIPSFATHLAARVGEPLRRGPVTPVQLNVGKRCNPACHHCHVDAGPKRTEAIDRRVAERVLDLLAKNPLVEVLDVTGGAPELSEQFRALVVCFVPASLLTLAAGAIFGLAEGTLLVFVAAVLGSTAAFLLSRTVAREAIARRVEGDRRFAAIDRAIEREGRRIVILLRLSPVFPFVLLNYALGLTRVRLADYLVASIGMLPGTLLYVYSGKVAGDLATLAGGAAVPRGAGYYAVIGLGFAATAVVTVLVTRVARRALRDAAVE